MWLKFGNEMPITKTEQHRTASYMIEKLETMISKWRNKADHEQYRVLANGANMLRDCADEVEDWLNEEVKL